MVHVGLAFAPEAQTREHIPQWLGLVPSVTHVPPHSVSPAPQPETQTPIWHTGVPPEHALEHEPQRDAVESDASQPLIGLPSQSPKPGKHEYAQTLIEHETVVLGRATQAAPQAPQWARFDRVSISQPLAMVPSQSLKPESQTSLQVPAMHAGLEFA